MFYHPPTHLWTHRGPVHGLKGFKKAIVFPYSTAKLRDLGKMRTHFLYLIYRRVKNLTI